MDQLTVFSLLFVAAIFVGVLVKRIKFPALLGYVIVGIVANMWPKEGLDTTIIHSLGSVGVMLLLFLIGLEMRVHDLMVSGLKLSLLTFFQLLGFISLLYLLIGYGTTSGFYIALPLIFSSTILCVKWLQERKDLNSAFGKLAVGILLFQDIGAVLLLVLIGGNGGVGQVIIRTIGAFVLSVMGGGVLIKYLHKVLRLNAEEIVMVGLSWCFLSAILAGKVFGLSMEIGGFLAGLSLSGFVEREHLGTKLKFLKEFFLTVFFVNLGMSFVISTSVVWVGIQYGLMVIFVKIIITYIFARLFGNGSRVSFLLGIGMAQISEFGLILVSLLVHKGFLSDDLAGVVSVAALMTMGTSAVLFKWADKLYLLLKPLLNKFSGGASQQNGDKREGVFDDHIVLIGCHRMGRSMVTNLKKSQRSNLVVVDFDNEVLVKMQEQGIRTVFADIGDADAYEVLNLKKAKLIISTVKDLNDNLTLLEYLKTHKLNTPIVVDAETKEDAQTLYKYGASYVVFPNFVGGLHLSEVVSRWLKRSDHLEKSRHKQVRYLDGVFGAN